MACFCPTFVINVYHEEGRRKVFFTSFEILHSKSRQTSFQLMCATNLFPCRFAKQCFQSNVCVTVKKGATTVEV